MKQFVFISIAFLLIVGGVLWSIGRARDDSAASPRELGPIHWNRNFDDAARAAHLDNDKPLLVLFDEVPGCTTCVAYGDSVLGHPLIHEAAETLFVPVAVYNNVSSGGDRKWLAQFDERAFDNPVVRLLSPADRTDLAPRVGDDYTVHGITAAMIATLEKTHRDVPTYLRLLALETSPLNTERATFAMPCFWSGEAFFGGRDGVIATSPGYLHGREVVEVDFDPAVVSFEKLMTDATAACYASRVFARTDNQQSLAVKQIGAERVERTDESARPDESPKFYLSQRSLKFLPMTRTQSCRVNAALHAKSDWKQYLSPRQLALLDRIERNPDAGWTDATHAPSFPNAWRYARAK